MRPTRRGVGVAVVGAAAVGMAAVSSARALNAIAAPAGVVLVASAVQLFVAGRPTLDRTAIPAGFPGEVRTVTIDLDGGGIARIDDEIPAGLAVRREEVRAALPATIDYEIGLADRGEWTIGPPTVVLTDVLGLFVRSVEPASTASVVVYPSLTDLRGHESIAGLFERGAIAERQAFDTIREYAPGDPLRDVHWKSSAKRDELIVKEFVGETADRTLSIAATATPGHADEMASAAASVAVIALDAGRSVGVTCPGGHVPVGRGDEHRRQVLELLARTGDGSIGDADREGATVEIAADDDGVRVTVEGRTHPLDLSETTDELVADGGRSSAGDLMPEREGSR